MTLFLLIMCVLCEWQILLLFLSPNKKKKCFFCFPRNIYSNMNWKLVDRILYYCYLKEIHWKEKTTCHIFLIILTFVKKIKDIKTTGVLMLILKMVIDKLEKKVSNRYISLCIWRKFLLKNNFIYFQTYPVTDTCWRLTGGRMVHVLL